MDLFPPSGGSPEIPSINSNSDFPFDLNDHEIIALKLSSAYELPSMDCFITTDLRIIGGIVDLANVPPGCIWIDLENSVVTNTKNKVIFCCERMRVFGCKCSCDIRGAAPNAHVEIGACQ
jgi:hypothetical protein